MTISVRLLALFYVLLGIGHAASASTIVDLDFNTDGVLPSAQGMTYQSLNGVGESNAYQVSGGALHIDTMSLVSNAYAYYSRSGGFDHTLPTVLETRLRIADNTTGIGVGFQFQDSALLGGFWIKNGSWYFQDASNYSGTFTDPSEFHTFVLSVAATTGAFDFSIDGVMVQQGVLPSYSGTSEFWFGDGTTTGGNVTADIDYIKYVNAVPEPSTFALAGVALTALGAYRLRRHRR